MGIFGEFVYGTSIVYGPTASPVRAEVLGNNLIVLYLDNEVLINETYLDPSSYEVTLYAGEGDAVTVLEVLPVNTPALHRVYLRTSYHTPGATYQVTVTGLTTRTGGPMSGVFKFVSRRTKLDQMYSNIPAHFSAEPNSLIKNVLAAISQSDDKIGGSRDDDLP